MTLSGAPYVWKSGLVSRSVSFENPEGKAGGGGMESSPLGQGRKGSAVRHIENGETVQLADIIGNGTIRHIWLTTHDKPHLLRGSLIRIYWEGQSHPSVELPLGEFFGFAHGKTNAFQSVFHSVGSTKAMNSWLLMPFTDRARIEYVNQSGARLPLFYQIDYTVGDSHERDVGRLHASFRREMHTSLGQDFEILGPRKGQIRYLGCVLGVRPRDELWWGEGEMKAYLDGDTDFPTIAGTGAEDYLGQAWGIQNEAFMHHGCNYKEHEDDANTGVVSAYRWHLADPIFCQDSMRITIQQIGHRPTGNTHTIDEYKAELFERSDDWSAAAFWYEKSTDQPLPALPAIDVRLADI